MTRLRVLARFDLPASIVVFLVALPLCLGIAIASGAPPATGLITGIVGGLLVGALSGSPLQVSGPAAGLTVICWDIIQNHGMAGLGVAVLVAGVIQAVAGLAGLGRWFRAVSPAVVYGMLAGIGVLIFASQFHVMVDDKPVSSGVQNLLAIPGAVYKGIVPSEASHHWAAMLGLITIVVILLWGNFRPKKLSLVPPPLVAIIITTLVATVIDAPVQYVQLPDDLIGSMSNFVFPGMSELTNTALLGAAVGLAIVASAETLLCAGAVDRMQDRVKANYNKELFAQGVGNFVCGLLGALPMTGVIVRSSANVESGARTRASAIIHGIWLLALVLLFPALVRLIPTSGLAAILVYTGYKLVNPAQIKELKKFGWSSVGIYAATVIGIVATDLLTGVMIGVALSVWRLLYRLGHISVDTRTTNDGERVDATFYGAATFVGLPKLTDALARLPEAREIHLHVDALRYIDHACMEAIGDWERERRGKGASVFIRWESLDARSDKVSASLSDRPGAQGQPGTSEAPPVDIAASS